MFGIGKPRSIFGRWADKKRILQREVEEETKLSRPIVTRLFNDKEYVPSPKTQRAILQFVRKRGWNAKSDDLWPLDM